MLLSYLSFIPKNDLDDFWSYFIFRLNLKNSERCYDNFARLYNLLSDNKKYLSQFKYINISLKESTEQYVFYIETNIEPVLKKLIQRLEILGFSYIYPCEKDTLSYSIYKNYPTKSPITQKKESIQHAVYDFIKQSDLDEMTICIKKMQDANYNNIYIHDISTYKETLTNYSSYLLLYPQLIAINNYVAELSMISSLYSDECNELGIDFRMLLQSFINNLRYWQEELFIKGGEELHFMDDSFKADFEQIKITLNLYDDIEEDSDSSLDDIFDF